MTPRPRMHLDVAGAALAGLAVRLVFVFRFPASGPGDSPLYEALARNWLDAGGYGLFLHGRFTPGDVRVPGYPAFLAAIYALWGRTGLAVLLTQAGLDLVTCFLIAALAAVLAPRESQRRVALAALWLAALCPFTANYTAAILTETLAIFLTALALLVFAPPSLSLDLRSAHAHFVVPLALVGGLLVGLGTLVRPETPLLLLAAGAALAWRWRRRRDWAKLLRATALMGIGLTLPLLPWAARNWHTLGRVQFLAHRYGELPGEYTPRGFYSWTGTWLWRFRDVYQVTWKLGKEPIRIGDLPSEAFDSPGERARVAHWLRQYNRTRAMTPRIDQGFAELAHGRTARLPLRTYVTIPALRALAMWFTPRLELLPFSGHLRPLRAQWEEDPVDVSVTLLFATLGYLYAAAAIAGARRARRHPGCAVLVAFIVIRTAFFTAIETPEPRYVLECFPAVLALAAQLWARKGRDPEAASTERRQRSSTGSGWIVTRKI